MSINQSPASKARLKRFWATPECADAEGPLRAWYTHVSKKDVAWGSWGDVKAAFGKASLVGNCVVFNIGGNKYRLIVRIFYASHKIYILKVMTHKEYDKDTWKEECRCFAPPPKRSRGAESVLKGLFKPPGDSKTPLRKIGAPNV